MVSMSGVAVSRLVNCCSRDGRDPNPLEEVFDVDLATASTLCRRRIIMNAMTRSTRRSTTAPPTIPPTCDLVSPPLSDDVVVALVFAIAASGGPVTLAMTPDVDNAEGFELVKLINGQPIIV